VLLVDDEPLALRALRRLVSRNADFVVAGTCRTAAQAIAAIERDAPHLVMLDIEMAGGRTGLDVVSTIGAERMPPVVFVTAHAEHSLDAFDVEAVDYVLKPFTDDRIERSLARAKARIRERRAGPPAPDAAAPALGRFKIRSGGRLVFVRAQDVDWIGAESYYARLHVGRQSHLLRETLTSLEHQLDPRLFVRIHRSSIVNLERVHEMTMRFKGDYAVVLTDGTELAVGRARRETLESRLRRGR
jgi:two-component system LytT family response regulator